MDCPKCGAFNPDGAEHCNLCFHSFIDRPEVTSEDEREPEPSAGDGATDMYSVPLLGRLSGRVLKQSGQGAIAAVGGGLVFLISLGFLQLIGIKALSFMFPKLGLDIAAVKFFILAAGLFAAFCGGIGGNLNGKRDAVPAIRMMAGLIGLAVWVGLLYAAKPADASLTFWLTGGLPGILVALSVFPVTAAFIGASESFGEEFDFSRAGYGAAGGLAAGLAASVVAGLALLAAPLFGTANPAGFFPVTLFSLKIIITVCLIGGLFGFGLWLGIGLADERA